MATTSRIYLGYKSHQPTPDMFRSESEPTQESHGGKYVYVVGPFVTARGARAMRDFGLNNPHMRCVAEAERVAASWARQEKQRRAEQAAMLAAD